MVGANPLSIVADCAVSDRLRAGAELAEREPRRAEAISLHTIGGMTVPMVAELLGVSVATVERDLALARAWLASQMK